MRKTPARCARALVACLTTAVVQLVVLAPAQSQVEAKRGEAASLQAEIEKQGQALSLADEQFNAARIERQAIEARATSVQSQVTAASQRWGELKSQLARRVRLLYMHPGAAIDAFLGSRSISDLARAQKLGSAVLTADTELVMATEKARHEVMARAETLGGIRDIARDKEQELASRRSDVNGALANQRTLLSKVKGDIAKLIAEERRQQLAQAQVQQEAQAQQGEDRAEEGAHEPSGPIIGGSAPGEEDTEPALEEPAGPPPPVNGGAGKAVSTAVAQLGKPYEWAADGPDSFDCSGLTMYAWSSAGVSLPHSSAAQYSSLPHVARNQLQAGDLVFFGSPIHHVGIYEGGGVMISAPQTGDNVRRDSISRADYVGAARP